MGGSNSKQKQSEANAPQPTNTQDVQAAQEASSPSSKENNGQGGPASSSFEADDTTTIETAEPGGANVDNMLANLEESNNQNPSPQQQPHALLGSNNGNSDTGLPPLASSPRSPNQNQTHQTNVAADGTGGGVGGGGAGKEEEEEEIDLNEGFNFKKHQEEQRRLNDEKEKEILRQQQLLDEEDGNGFDDDVDELQNTDSKPKDKEELLTQEQLEFEKMQAKFRMANSKTTPAPSSSTDYTLNNNENNNNHSGENVHDTAANEHLDEDDEELMNALMDD